jgi:hypothetical protein
LNPRRAARLAGAATARASLRLAHDRTSQEEAPNDDAVQQSHVFLRGTLRPLILSILSGSGEPDGRGKGRATVDKTSDQIRAEQARNVSPLITFMVGTDPEVTVTTTGSTQYFGVACETLADDAVVNLEGTLQLDGSIAATTISIVPVVVDIPVEPLLP